MARFGIHHNRKKRNHPAECGLALQQAVVFMLFLGMLLSAGALIFVIQSKGASLFGGNKENHSTAVNHHEPLHAPTVSRIEYQVKLDKAQTHLQELEKAFRKDREETIREHSRQAENESAEQQTTDPGVEEEAGSPLSLQSQTKLLHAKHELKLINRTLSHLKSVMHSSVDSRGVIPVSNPNSDVLRSDSSTELPEQSFILGDTAYTAPVPANYKKVFISSDTENDILPATLENAASTAPVAGNPNIPFLPPDAEPSLAKLNSSAVDAVPNVETQVIALQKKLLKTEIQVLEIESQENKLANKLIQPIAWHNSKQFYAKQARQANLEESLQRLKNDILDLDTAIPDLKAGGPQQQETQNKETLHSPKASTPLAKAFVPNHYRSKSNPFHELAGYQVFPNRDISFRPSSERQIIANAASKPSFKGVDRLNSPPLEGWQAKHDGVVAGSIDTNHQTLSIKGSSLLDEPPRAKAHPSKRGEFYPDISILKKKIRQLKGNFTSLSRSPWANNARSFWPWALLSCLGLGIGLYSLMKSRKASAVYIAKLLPSAYPGLLPWVSNHQWTYHREHNRLELVTELVPEFNQAIEDYTQKLLQHRQESGPSVLLASAISDNEGQESLLANLALGLAHHGEKVLLIDADLQAPKLHQAFNQDMDYERGLPELLNWIAEKKQHAQLSLHLDSAIEQHLYDYITASGIHEKLHYLNAGCSMSESLSFFQDQGLQTLINSCKHFYDWIIINAPPLLKQSSEVEALSIPVDGLVLMVDRYSPERKIQKASEQIEALNCPIFATVTRS